MHAIQKLAQQYLDCFELGTRSNGDTFWCRKGEHKEDVLAILIRAAHGNMIPDDYKYAYIVDALDAIVNSFEINDDEELTNADFYDVINEIEADISNYDLCKWLASHCYRPCYCDEAIEELGVTPTSIIEFIQYGQCKEKQEVYLSVYHTLTNLLAFEEA